MILLDSDVLIDFLRGDPPTVLFIQTSVDRGEELATTPINVGEVLRGERTKRGRRTAEAFFASLTELAIANSTGHRYATLMERLDRKGATMPALDGFIAAAAMEYGAAVATRNVTHFSRVPQLDVLTPG